MVPFSPSFDRIDNTQGYTRDNVQLVCLIYNTAKNAHTHEDLLKLARALVSEQ